MAEERNLQQRQHNGHGAQDVGGALAQQASNTAEQMGRAVQQGVGRANAALSAMSERSGKAAERTGEVLGNFRSAIETSARSQPTTTVALAALAGFVFGAFWRMGSR
jgi:glyceraldehyde-3-phosphate dehydrogenase/erythrose-4-phosphate dehydrogenase